MAVVQISRIQQRRGKKQSATGFPQLASGEIGWAIDTQELYIGNGSVSEGAPYVGNTQILTEHVNILDYAEKYQYLKNSFAIQTGPNSLSPVQRTLQERFDERVDIRSFIPVNKVDSNGAISTADVTVDLQRAIDQLFLTDSTNGPDTKVVLYFGPGTYFISQELKIPAYTTIHGAGIDSTIIKFTTTNSTNAVMRMVDSNSTPGNYTPFASMNYEMRPKYINIENMTIETSSSNPIIQLDNTDSAIFNQVKFVGTYINGFQPTGSDPADATFQAAIYSRSTSGVHRPENVQFHSCIFNKTGFGYFSKSDHNDIGFSECQFYQLYDGINVGGEIFGAVNTKVSSCHFDLIDRYGIWIKKGYGNTSINNKYMLVGNNNQGYANATYPIIRYDNTNNQSLNDYFERNRKLKDQTVFGLIPFYPNVRSSGLVSDPTNFVKILENTPIYPIEFFRFPVYDSSIFIIDYVINKNTIGSAIRTGTIHVTVNFPAIKTHIQDEYTYTGSSTVENIEFSVSLADLDGDTVRETLILNLFNPTGNGVGTMNYSYRTMTK